MGWLLPELELHFAIVGVRRVDPEVLANALDGDGGYMVGAVGKAAEGDIQIHSVLRIIHPGSNGDGLKLLHILVEAQGDGVAGLVVVMDDELDFSRMLPPGMMAMLPLA